MPDVPSHGLQLRSLVTTEATLELSVVEAPVPSPGADEVLVRVEAAPINPSDIGLLLAGADVTQARRASSGRNPVAAAPMPAGAVTAEKARTGQSLTVGNEGAGTVVAAGSSAQAQALLGKVVAVVGGGMYSQYRALPVRSCLELPDGTPASAGAGSFVNPMTVLAMVETMRAEGHTALVHTAAASNLGQMLLRVCRQDDIALVNIVRSDEQVDRLRAAGAEHVCNSSAKSFREDLTMALQSTGATLAFDAVGGGRLAGDILSCMEAAASAGAEFSRYGSSVHKQVYLYGALDRSRTELDRSYGMAWGVGGWLLTPRLQQAGAGRVAELRQRVAHDLQSVFASSYTDTITLEQALDPEVIGAYARQATGQKHLVTPHG